MLVRARTRCVPKKVMRFSWLGKWSNQQNLIISLGTIGRTVERKLWRVTLQVEMEIGR